MKVTNLTDTDSRAMPLELRMATAGYGQRKKRTRSEPKAMTEIKFAAIREAISAFGGHRKKAAERLQISEATLYRALRKMKSEKEKI